MDPRILALQKMILGIQAQVGLVSEYMQISSLFDDIRREPEMRELLNGVDGLMWAATSRLGSLQQVIDDARSE